jgi:hypothetical protein
MTTSENLCLQYVLVIKHIKTEKTDHKKYLINGYLFFFAETTIINRCKKQSPKI